MVTPEAIANRADELDIRLTPDAEHIDGPATLAAEIEETIITNRSEVLFRLAVKERTEVLARLESLRQRIDDESIPFQERETLVRTELDGNLDRLGVLERVLHDYERSGLAQWYTEGWILVRSELLNETVVVVCDEKVKLPAGARQFPVYRFVEVQALDGADDETIRRAHRTKKVFRGEVVSA